jgi:hypothetical protein
MLVSVEGRRVGLYVLPVNEVRKPRVVALFSDLDVRSFGWANVNALVFDTVDRRLGGGEQPYARGRFSVSADGSQLRQLVHFSNPFVRVNPSSRLQMEEPLPWNHILLHRIPGGSKEVVVGRRELDNFSLF